MDTLTYSALNCVLGSKDKDVKIESLPLSVKRINDDQMRSFIPLMIGDYFTAHFKMIGLHFTSEERKMRNPWRLDCTPGVLSHLDCQI